MNGKDAFRLVLVLHDECDEASTSNRRVNINEVIEGVEGLRVDIGLGVGLQGRTIV